MRFLRSDMHQTQLRAVEMHDRVITHDPARRVPLRKIERPAHAKLVHLCSKLACPLAVQPGMASEKNIGMQAARTLLAHELEERTLGPSYLHVPENVEYPPRSCRCPPRPVHRYAHPNSPARLHAS